MNLAIGVNHCVPYFVGGSERVVQQITDSMSREYGMKCHVFSPFAAGDTIHNGVHVWKPKTADEMLFKIRSLKIDHFHIYSDYFMAWADILRKSEMYKCDKSISLVGMNNMRERLELMSLFKQKHKQFKVVTHSSDYLDYQSCNDLKIPVTVIPNAIDLSEFKDKGFSFREKYKITTSKIVLCVSNFYPGKGQEHLVKILSSLSKRFDDFTAVFICTTVNFAPAKTLRANLSQYLSTAPFPSKMLVDISREDTLQAFAESDVFAFSSQIEVAPLVVLESMAAKLPYVSLDVGNVSSLAGGIVVKGDSKVEGKWQYTPRVFSEFEEALFLLLTNKQKCLELSSAGRKRIEAEFNWENSKKMYYKLFTGKDAV